MVIVVNTDRSGSNDKTTWQWFHVPLTPVFNLEHGTTSVRLKVSLKKKDGGNLNRDQVLLGGPGIPGVDLGYRNASRAALVVISPYLISYGSYARTVTLPRATRLTQEELPQMAGIHCAVEPVAGTGR